MSHLKDETNRLISSELEIKCEQKDKLQRTEEELLVARTELDCLKRELHEKNSLINVERTKLAELIRSQEVHFFRMIFFELQNISDVLIKFSIFLYTLEGN